MQPLPIESTKLTTAEFVSQCRDMMIPLAGSLAYFSVIPLDEKEYERLILDPTSAFPPRLSEIIPKLRLVMVPYLETDPENGEQNAGFRIAFQPPPDEAKRFAAYVGSEGENYLFLAIRDEEVFDAHILLYRCLAKRIVEDAGEEFTAPFNALLHAELESKAHGEVHEGSWQLKRELLSRQWDAEDRPSLLSQYRAQALEDTLTLYLHGLCCDIDIEAGPKQLASQHMRKRLLLLKEQLPPPDGVTLFPEDLADVP